ncbi:MAG TPA: tripartite tricarboxylate transporter substrate binding protein [Xanthobacteraceae bacterium]|nr:tripartite tricarboxylate transporter substrate binding protein [Xanthobacteraceae bacterium]
MLTRRTLLTAACACALSAGTGEAALAQAYPNRPIKMIVPYPPAGPIDIMARLLGQQLSNAFGQQLVVENRPGAGSILGTKAAATAEPDGYTLLFASSGSLAVAPALYANYDVDILKAFVPVGEVALLPHVLVVANSVPARTVAEFISYAKANPGKLNYGASLGTPPHLLSTLFKTRAGIDVVYVPYKGSAASVTDLLAGETQFTIDGLTGLYPLIKDRKVRALAIARAQRWPDLPDVPTLVESGFPDFTVDAWTGVVAPAGTPDAVVATLNRAINAGLGTAEAKEGLARFNAIAQTSSPQEFGRFIASEMAKWAGIVKLAGARIDP